MEKKKSLRAKMKNLFVKIKEFFKRNGSKIWKGFLFVLGGIAAVLGLKGLIDKKQVERNEKTSEEADTEVEKADEVIKDAKEVVKDNEEIIKKYSKKTNN